MKVWEFRGTVLQKLFVRKQNNLLCFSSIHWKRELDKQKDREKGKKREEAKEKKEIERELEW